MGVYVEYLDRNMSFEEITAERKMLLRRISELRGGRDIFVYAADIDVVAPIPVPFDIRAEDLIPIRDQVGGLVGTAIDVILETPGGSGEATEDIVRFLRSKYQDVAFVVPGTAKSAGTIMTMSGNEILMDDTSSLGPIDAQLSWQGKRFSADAFLKGIDKIKDEVTKTGVLNRAYIPILQNISPGEIEHAKNALDFAKVLVTKWLALYKFQNWKTHESTGKEVSEAEREKRAEEIAGALCDHGRWLTHGRSIKLEDLEMMRVKITNFGTTGELAEVIRRYYILMQLTFDTTGIYKIFETPDTQVYKFLSQEVAPAEATPPKDTQKAIAEVRCTKCKSPFKVQLNFQPNLPLEPGCLPFPQSDRLKCPACGIIHDLSGLRRQVELQSRKSVIKNKGENV